MTARRSRFIKGLRFILAKDLGKEKADSWVEDNKSYIIRKFYMGATTKELVEKAVRDS